MEELQHREALLRAYIRSSPQAISELIAVAQRTTSKAEYRVFENYLKSSRTETSPSESKPTREQTLLNSACKKLTEFLQPKSGDPKSKSESLVELLYFAEMARTAKARDSPWHILNQDLVQGISWTKTYSSGASIHNNVSEGRTRMNTLRIIGNLYGKELCEVTPRYSIAKKIERVVDLYYLTEWNIEAFAFYRHIPCGTKTLLHINKTLAAHGLPALNAVVR